MLATLSLNRLHSCLKQITSVHRKVSYGHGNCHLASCLIYAWAVPAMAHPLPVATSTEIGSDQSAVRSWQSSDLSHLTADWPLPISVLVWVRSFIEPDLFENNVPFDNTTPIYLTNLL